MKHVNSLRKARARILLAVLMSLPIGMTSWAQSAEQAASAQRTYARTCGYCHTTGVGPALLGRNLPVALSSYFARHGNRAMPAFKPTDISDAELAELAEYISQSGPASPSNAGETP